MKAIIKKPTSKHINTVTAKNQLNALIIQSQQTGEAIIIEKRGLPVAVLLDFAKYQEQLGKAKQVSGEKIANFKRLKAFHHSMKQKHPDTNIDSTKMIRQLREERLKSL